MNHFDKFYIKILKSTLTKPPTPEKRLFHKVQPKDKLYTKISLGVTYKTDIQKNGLPILTIRKLNLKVFVGETFWFIRGDNDPNGIIRHFTKIWDDFIEDDGTVTSYGNRWRKWFKRDQLIEVIESLKRYQHTRHAVIITWDPATDSLISGKKRMNVPCNLGMIFNVVNNRLNMHSIWRSQDLILGYPNDVAGQSLLLVLLARHLGLKPGFYIHYTANLHIYNNQIDIAKDLITRKNQHGKIQLNLNEDLFNESLKSDKHAIKAGEQVLKVLKEQYKPSGKIKVKIVV